MTSTADCTAMKRPHHIIDDTLIKKKYRLTGAQTDRKTDIERRRSGWYRMYWLDGSKAQNPIADYGINQCQLRGTIDYLEISTMASEYIKKTEQPEIEDEQIIAIITVLNNAYVIEKIQSLSQVHSIYIHVSSTEESSKINKNSLRLYPKVSRTVSYQLQFNSIDCFMMKGKRSFQSSSFANEDAFMLDSSAYVSFSDTSTRAIRWTRTQKRVHRSTLHNMPTRPK